LFNKAGPLEHAKIVPAKDGCTFTFGFVRYKTKANASHALEMFKDYKLGDRILKVRFSTGKSFNTDRSNNNSGASSSVSAARPSRSVVIDDEDWQDAEKSSSRSASRGNSVQPPRGRSICRDAMATSLSKSDVNDIGDESR
jgi:RNA recognition motif-containing protein